MKLMVDSGSDISLISRLILIDNSKVRNTNIEIVGIGGTIIPLGTINIPLMFDFQTIEHEFKIVSEDSLPRTVHGILGRDFLNKHGVKLNYFQGTFIINDTTIALYPGEHRVFLATSREQTILNALQPQLNNCPDHLRPQLGDAILKYLDVFRLDTEAVPANNFYTQKIILKDLAPVYIPQYRLPHAHKEMMREQIRQMLENDIIQPSTSHYNNPNLMVPKKNGSWRMVTDFRQLNKKILADKYPIPRFDDIFDGLGIQNKESQEAKIFSTFDLTKGFYQIPLDKASRKYTAFTAEDGFYEYKRLPFGISIAPNSFSRMMATAFRGVVGKNGFVFMDDYVAKSDTPENHLQEIIKVFDICRTHRLSLSPTKTTLFRPKVIYLGHELTDKGIYPDRVRKEQILNFPTPTNKDEIKQFVSVIGFNRRFIKDFAKVAEPLNRMTAKKETFNWTDEQEKSFRELKRLWDTADCLAYPNFTLPFIIETDASNKGLGAVLKQAFNNEEKAIHYASCGLKQGEKSKSTIEKELLAIYWGIKYFRPYIYGTKFHLRSDHRPLVYLFSLRDPTSKLNRIRMELEEHDFVIEYVPGKLNSEADGMSRIDHERLTSGKQFLHLDELRAVKSVTMAVTTRLQARRENEKFSKEGNSSESVQAKESQPEMPLNNNINNKNEKMIEHKKLNNENINKNENKIINILEANSFASRRYPELTYDHGAGLVIAGYNLRRVKENRVLALKQKINKKVLGADLTALFKKLEKAAAACNIKFFRLSLSDELFKQCTIEEIKENAGGLNTVKIFLYRAPIILNKNIKEERSQIEYLLRLYHHNKVTGAHSGYNRFLNKLKMSYYWKGMAKDTKRIVRECIKCMLNKPSRKTRQDLTITETPEKAMELLSMDTVGPLMSSEEGYRYILTIQDNLSKFITLVPMKSKEAKEIARALYQGHMYIHGFCKGIVSDLGSEYCNMIIKELLADSEIEHKTSAGYRPQTIGGLERNHRVLNEYLRSYLPDTNNNWPDLLKAYQFAYNSTPNAAIGDLTPYEVVFGKPPILPDFLSSTTITPVYNIDNYAQLLKSQLQAIQSIARTHLEKEKAIQKRKYDVTANPLKIEIGEHVKITNEKRNKYDPKYKGPYTVIKTEEPNIYIQKQGQKKIKKIHMDRAVKINI